MAKGETYSIKVGGKTVHIHRNEVGNPVAKIGIYSAQGTDWSPESITGIVNDVISKESKATADALERVANIEKVKAQLAVKA